MKKPRLVTIFSLILILAGLGLTAYPIISNILAQKNASEAIEDYDDQIQDMDEEKIDAVKESMKQYNQQLGHAVVQDETSEAVKEAAEAAGDDNNTDADGTDTEGGTHTTMMEIGDVIGYLTIPVIDVNLPIYYGTSQEVLAKGVGYVPETSFPLGGESTHSVLTGHRGLPEAKLFTDMDPHVASVASALHGGRGRGGGGHRDRRSEAAGI